MTVKRIVKKFLAKVGYEIKRVHRQSDLSVIRHIQSATIKELSDPMFLESNLLLKLGLNDEQLEQMPEGLYSFCGHGLYYWQYPNQLSAYLIQLSKYRIDTYLEIGIRHGGTFIITIEYLNRFNPLRYAIGVDIENFPAVADYKKINRDANFMLMDSQSNAFKDLIQHHPGFDLVMIDGNHDERICQSDFETIKDKSNICVFHDITSDVEPGPGKVWGKLRNLYKDEYDFFEFVDQYKSVTRRTNKKYLGIGMAVRKNFKTQLPSSFADGHRPWKA